MNLDELKESVYHANLEIVKRGLVMLYWGNVSAVDRPSRLSSGLMAIKPSGVPYELMTPKDIVVLSLEGRVIQGDKNPSTDTPTHLVLYNNFPDIGAVVHTHSTYATIFAQAKIPIVCYGTTHADHFHGKIPVTEELPEDKINADYETNAGLSIVKYFKDHDINPMEMPACLLANHGPFVWGPSLEAAVENAIVLEQVARMNLETLALNDSIISIKSALLDRHFFRKHGNQAYYGQKNVKDST
jgi:L-ribulose-5-phosphate 4-epimerase